VTVYRRPDPIPLHRSRPAADFSLRTVRSEPEDLHRLVSRQIFAAIRSGRYAEGSVLPNEMVLSEELGVSRTALREAVKGLASKGMLETRRRRGTLVLSRGEWNLLDPEVIGWLRRDDGAAVSEQLWEAIAAVLPGVVAMAASRRANPDAPEATTMDLDAKIRFLLALAQATANRFLLSMVSGSLRSILEADPAFLESRLRWLDIDAARALTMQIAQGKTEGAAMWMRERLADLATLDA
jgi:DNA-binding FadR family transcriptional regulator